MALPRVLSLSDRDFGPVVLRPSRRPGDDHTQHLLRVMISAIEQAGFVNVRGRIRKDGHYVELGVMADCPCGLGTSGFSYSPSPWEQSPYEEENVSKRFFYMAKKHIEEDKAAGRWVE